ncbi:ABC transporter ATP-binding protein [Candidatus Marinimicrobia bacterium PRS2]|nr:ABC transporter ATP-binding protein [Candidatus Marinimicrobia bacterium PRS2]
MLEAHNISKTYYKMEESIPVLNKLNLIVEKGEIIVLMGPSGSGKSTLLNILGTLDSDYSGELIIDELPITNAVDLSNIRRHKLGFIFQFHHLLPEFTILENLLIPQMIADNYSNVPQEDTIDMLENIGLKARMNHYPNEISGGERQRVAVLRAMVNNPCLILADEPTGNLDRENSLKMLKLMTELKAKYQQSFIIATHDQSILDIADRVLYLKDGKIKKEI